ncbi:YbbR-like protein [Leeuwenhoekiella aestuarii]|uniref:YbbR-like protein n=1 Tax=Leeuwenhoekiella aestuarii TaxID=2249426 RepID=A0A4Q0NWQ8_9FLAO|nr:CdaR family protein [Leeuwenhoekiella aestuarii]RXG15507.1 YbbR-like protein [Leeuwenhoekiella aestuarii]RXG17386.1 YbbR-like protein [Leeuwenhoekiella aestuarii]
MADRKKRSKNANLRVFMTILVVVATISVMIKLNRNFSFTVKVPLKFQNLSEDQILKSASTNTVEVTGKASGYDYFKYRFFSQDFPIDLSQLSRNKNRSYYVFNDENDALKGSLSGSEITSFEPDTVFFDLDRNFDKKIPVVPKYSITFAPGYGSLAGFKIKPDSITIRGPQTEVDTISQIFTEELKFQDVRNSKADSINLTFGKDIPLVNLAPGRVAYTLAVDKFTEGNVSVPLQLINVPSNVTAKVFPKRVNVIFNVNLSNYEQVKSSDFKVVVDFNEIDSLSTSLTPQVLEAPEYVRDIRLSESTVQYLLVK